MTLCKYLTFQANKGAGTMAVLLLLALGAALSGCLVPQDDQVFPALPPKKNSAPKIVGEKPVQRVTTVAVGPVTAGCPRVEFSVSVKDEDTADTIRSIWFVDAAPDFRPTPSSPEFVGAPVFGGSDLVRTVKAPASVITQLTGLIDGRSHRVDVWITDGEFAADSIDVTHPPVPLADGTTSFDCATSLPDGGRPQFCDSAYKDNYVWLVEVQSCQ